MSIGKYAPIPAFTGLAPWAPLATYSCIDLGQFIVYFRLPPYFLPPYAKRLCE
jgi:hypothetical protein